MISIVVAVLGAIVLIFLLVGLGGRNRTRGDTASNAPTSGRLSEAPPDQANREAK